MLIVEQYSILRGGVDWGRVRASCSGDASERTPVRVLDQKMERMTLMLEHIARGMRHVPASVDAR
eukprot:COSAG01_NODE_246_length_20450_cov_195.166822_11_plen_65_part_00